MTPQQALPFTPERVLVVGAHPDDAEFFAGGTLLRLREAGAAVTLLVCTDGARGGGEGLDAARVRAAEQKQAAARLGLAGWRGLGRADGGLVADDALCRELVLALRNERPELVLAHDPRTLWTAVGEIVHPGHSDHRSAGQAVLDAVYPRAPSPHFYADQLEGAGAEPIPGFEATRVSVATKPWYPREVWLFDTAAPDLRVDVAAVFERKLEVLRAHESQEAVAGGLLGAARALGAHWGAPERPAEAFARLRLY